MILVVIINLLAMVNTNTCYIIHMKMNMNMNTVIYFKVYAELL